MLLLNQPVVLAFAALAAWMLVWLNRELPVPAIGSGVSSSAIAWTYRAVVSGIAIIVVMAPLFAVVQVLSLLV
jgi:hypothetical protein